MKKKIYFQPEVQVAHIALESMVLAGSTTGNAMNFNNIEGDQW